MGLGILSPKFLTLICSPIDDLFVFSIGIKSFITPVILISTFLVGSPFSKPKIVSLDLILSVEYMGAVIPSQSKNWFIVLLA